MENRVEHEIQSDIVSDPPQPQACIGNEKDDKTSLIHQSRRPALSSLQIPQWSLDTTALSSFANTDDGPSLSSPASTGGLPPRPTSAKVRPSIRSSLPQRSFRPKTSSEGVSTETTVLIVPDTPPSHAPSDKPSTSSSLSLHNKVFFSPSTKAAHSVPVTPITTSGAEDVHGRHLGCGSGSSV